MIALSNAVMYSKYQFPPAPLVQASRLVLTLASVPLAKIQERKPHRFALCFFRSHFSRDDWTFFELVYQGLDSVASLNE